jgi:hypothetical protein
MDIEHMALMGLGGLGTIGGMSWMIKRLFAKLDSKVDKPEKGDDVVLTEKYHEAICGGRVAKIEKLILETKEEIIEAVKENNK